MSGSPELHTERLNLKPLHAADIDDVSLDLHKIHSDEQTMKFMPRVAHENEQFTREELRREVSRDGAHHWTVHLRGNPAVIGLVNYLGETRVPGLGYIIRRDHWGRGIATEACRAAVEFGFSELGYELVELWINESNRASQRVAEKLGFGMKGQLAQRYAHEADHHVMLVYGMKKSQWLGDRSGPSETRFFRIQPVLNVHNVVEAAAFYRDTLGFSVDYLFGDPPDHAGVSRGEWSGSTITLQLNQVPRDREITPSGYL